VDTSDGPPRHSAINTHHLTILREIPIAARPASRIPGGLDYPQLPSTRIDELRTKQVHVFFEQQCAHVESFRLHRRTANSKDHSLIPHGSFAVLPQVWGKIRAVSQKSPEFLGSSPQAATSKIANGPIPATFVVATRSRRHEHKRRTRDTNSNMENLCE
jgi:hypothetical protein